MKVERGFRYFVDNKEVVYKDLQTMIRLDMTVHRDGLNVHYSSPKKEIKTETFGDYVITTVPVKTSNKDRQKLQEIQNIFKEKENKKMNRLIEEELERQWTISSSPTEGTVSAPECSTNLSNKYYPHDGSKEGIKAAGQKILEELERQEQKVFRDWNNTMDIIIEECDKIEVEKRGEAIRRKPSGILGGSQYLPSFAKETAKRLAQTKKDGIKENDGKLYYELSWEFIEEIAKRMANNKSDKYPLYNWKKNINIEELKQAINRHHIEVMKGNYKDGDEVLGHIVSYACNSMMLWEQLNKNN